MTITRASTRILLASIFLLLALSGILVAETAGAPDGSAAPTATVAPGGDSAGADFSGSKNLESLKSSSRQQVPFFGYEVFARFSGQSPAEIPLRPDYVVGPGDQFECSIWGRDEAVFSIGVNVDGDVIIPRYGPVKVAGLTYADMKQAIEDALSSRISDFKLNIVPLAQRRIRVYVLGEAVKPGVYDVAGAATAYSVLFAAGGPSRRGSMRDIVLKRGNKAVALIDLYDFLLEGNRTTDVPLQEGDVVHIPLAGNRVVVQGQVKRAAVYEISSKDNRLAAIIAMAGGVLPGGDIENIRVERTLAHDRKIVFNANISDKPVAGSENNLSCNDSDVITVYSLSPRLEEKVTLEGHVFEPGPRPWKRGMRIADILTDAALLKQDPYLDYAEIYRETGPGGRLELLTFSPKMVLAGDAESNLLLHARDLIRILARSEINEIPRAKIMGEVVRPGKYELFDGMTVRDLIIKAGGFKVGADLSRGDFTRPVRNGGVWEIERSIIDLQAAMDNCPGKNPLLNPDDVLAVRATPDWKRDNIVRIAGEVLYPGEYTFEPGERISDLIKRSGGYTPRAYLPAAYFKRISALAQQERQIAMIKRNTQLEQQVEAIRIASERAEKEDKTTAAFDQQQMKMLEQLGSAKPTGRLVINIVDTEEFAGSIQDLELEPGDELLIPQRPSTVVVEGAVGNPTVLSWEANKNMLYYINKAGGVSRYGRRDESRLIRADGSALAATGRHRPAHSFLGTKVEPGDVIWVPVDMRPRQVSRWKHVTDLTQILGNLAITYIAVDNARR